MKIQKNLLYKLKKKLHNTSLTIGSWIQLDEANSALIISKSKFEWIAVDLEHGFFSENNLPNIFKSILMGEAIPFARIKNSNKTSIVRAMDAGAYGLIVPNIESREQLQNVIKYANYPPKGKRGVGYCPANNYGNNFKEYMDTIKNPIIIAMIESKKGLENIDEIISCKGFDGILIGPYDLSASLNITAKFSNHKFKSAIKKILNVCKSNKISVGMHQVKPSISDLKKLVNQGFNFIPYGMDSVFLSNNYPIIGRK
jgi:2-dehydro-3-deoxyglucarate aldolase